MTKLNNVINYAAFMAEMNNAAIAAGFIKRTLGMVEGEPIILLTKDYGDSINKKSILVAAGFHGDEGQGPWSVVQYIKRYGNKTLENTCVSFLPLVNPEGFMRGQRGDLAHDDPNRGWEGELASHASEEGIIILQNFQEIYNVSVDGFLTLHDNIDDFFYINIADDSDMLEKKINAAASGFFKVGKAGKPLSNSFEGFLFRLGIRPVVVSEMPGKQPGKEGIEAGVDVIKAFVGYYEEEGWNV